MGSFDHDLSDEDDEMRWYTACTTPMDQSACASPVELTLTDETRWATPATAVSRSSTLKTEVIDTLVDPLMVLKEPDGGSSTVDIIFIHGLGGHPIDTWKAAWDDHSSNSIWPRDILGPDFPTARILTYGYDSAELRHNMGISSLARHLLGSIRASRNGGGVDRNIIWVAHSFGGLLLKEVRKAGTTDPNDSLVFSTTIGIIFLGTPHQVTNSSSWFDLLSETKAISAPMKESLNFLKKTQNEVLHDLLTFRNILNDGRIRVVSFFETRAIATEQGPRLVREPITITEPVTALDHQLERVGHIEGNHFTICKFADELQSGYIQIRRAISDVLQAGIDQLEKLSDLRERIKTPWTRRKPLAQRLPETCEWLLKSLTYEEWQTSPSRNILHITGPPGSGKTVLARFLVDHLAIRSQSSGDGRVRCVLHFFFDFKEGYHGSFLALVRTFLLQLLDANPGLVRHLQWRSEPVRSVDTEGLTSLLFSMLKDPEMEEIVCIVDGFDECEEASLEDLKRFIQEFCRIPGTKAAVTCRQDVELEKVLPSCEGRSLAIDVSKTNGNLRDTQLFVKKRVASFSPGFPLPTDIRRKMEANLLANHGSRFVWVILVFQVLRRLRTQREIRDFFDNLPHELDDVYGIILRQVDLSRKDVVLRSLYFTKYAIRPLRKDELRTTLNIRDDDTDLSEIIDRQEVYLEKILTDQVGQLLQVQENVLSLLHPNFNNYLDKMPGRPDPSQIHLEIATACLVYLNLDDLWRGEENRDFTKEGIERKCAAFPFLEYASLYWPDHFRAAGDEASSLQGLARKLFATDSVKSRFWLKFFSGSARAPTLLPSEISIANVLAALDLLDVVWNVGPTSELSPTTLNCAARNSATKAFKFLIEKHRADPLTKDDNGQTAISCALQARNTGIVEWLINTSNDPHQSMKLRQSISLIDAVESQSTSLVKYLLDHGADTKERRSDGRTALHVAVQTERGDIVRLLLERVKDTGVRDSRGRNCLHLAASNGNSKIASMLLERGGGSNVTDELGQTALHYSAGKAGSFEVVNLLVRWRADLHSKDLKGRTPMHHAAASGNVEVVKLLMDCVSDAFGPDKKGRSPFFLACAAGWLKTAKLLLQRGSSVIWRDNCLRTPLHVASSNGAFDIVELLLSHGVVDLSAADINGRTALHEAALHSWLPIVERLLQAGLGVNARDNRGRTPFHDACRSNNPSDAVVQLLLSRNALHNIPDKDGHIPLHHAAEKDKIVVVTELAIHGSNVDATDKRGRTPLHAACQSKRVSVSMLNTLIKKHRASANPRDADGNTPLHLACQSAYTSDVILEALITGGANLDERNSDEMTPLHILCQSRHTTAAMLKVFVRHGADTSILDRYGKTAADYAREKEIWDAVSVLTNGLPPPNDRHVLLLGVGTQSAPTTSAGVLDLDELDLDDAGVGGVIVGGVQTDSPGSISDSY
ncbi:hypothetical protein GP486_002097 [Trichoglossum hirsutum]|uniref:NACHT domain-containing protein n=1 Tax=Trichoglossum hirsutum TaxID=265104 RepID=A0A9P8LFV4_9PEZI|nr:hypothetical protein GP486_002097 [Trichoglossum hirsutum]